MGFFHNLNPKSIHSVDLESSAMNYDELIFSDAFV